MLALAVTLFAENTANKLLWWSSLLCTPCAKGQPWIMHQLLCALSHTLINVRVFLCIRAAAASLNKDSTGSRITVCCLAHRTLKSSIAKQWGRYARIKLLETKNKVLCAPTWCLNSYSFSLALSFHPLSIWSTPVGDDDLRDDDSLPRSRPLTDVRALGVRVSDAAARGVPPGDV